MEWNFRNKVINGIDATFWTNNTYGAKRIYKVDYISCIDWLVVDGIGWIELFDWTAGFCGLKQYK